MKNYTVNGIEFKCPEGWHEITIEQLLKITAGPTRPIESLVICTGISEGEWNKSTDLKLVEELEATLQFLSTAQAFDPNKKPEKIVLNGVEVSPISDIGTLSTGQYQDLKLEIDNFYKEEGVEMDTIRKLSLYPKIVSIYLQPFITGGEYDFKKADEITQQLYHYLAVEVSAWGNFFIRRFQELRSGILKDVQKSVMRPKKQKRGFRTFLNRLAGPLFSTT